MPKFLFTAVDRNGKSITERVEAGNLSQARYKLELNNYSEIAFYESELAHDVNNLFEKKQIENQHKFPKQQVALQYDTTLTSTFLNIFKYTFFWWLILLYNVLTDFSFFTFAWLGGSILVIAYFVLPTIIFNRLYEAHCWNKNKEVRFWSNTGRWFNKIAVVKIPYLELDTHLGCADAREGRVKTAVERIVKYKNDSKVSERLYKMALIRIYGNARDFDKVLCLYEDSFAQGDYNFEELLDYAICLARRHKQTSRARNVLEKFFEYETTVLTKLFALYCQGVIEIEDKNFLQAEFYLQRAVKELEPFSKNSYLVGLRSEVKAFLALALFNNGQTDNAKKLYDEAKPYLIAVNENDLLQRCEAILR